MVVAVVLVGKFSPSVPSRWQEPKLPEPAPAASECVHWQEATLRSGTGILTQAL